MVFSSMTFLFAFLPTVVLLYTVCPRGFRNFFLLLASLVFYAWGEPKMVCLMLLSILVNYIFGRIIEKDRRQDWPYSAWNLGFAIGWNLLALAIFKYFAAVSKTLHGLVPSLFPAVSIVLPIGISFYTFQAISYLIDVYRGKTRAQKNLIDFGLYIAMFPQLIAGPIVRYTQIKQQLWHRKQSWGSFGIGCEFFVRGLVKKVLLANSLGVLFTRIQGLPDGQASVITAWVGALAFTLQIYFDFSGYSDMAVGLGRMFGFRFPRNFLYPYIATSVSDFWRRWHITLSSWFREYVYIPLGGNRGSVGKHIRNLLIVWTLTGIWHGAGWNFLLWGMYYGALLVLDKYVVGEFFDRHKRLGWLSTMVAVMIGWMIFANTDASLLGTCFRRLFGLGSVSFWNATSGYFLRCGWRLLLLGIVFATPIPHNINEHLMVKYQNYSVALRVFLFLLCVAALVYQSYNPFLYFRF